MKKYLLSALLLAAVNLVQAQLKEGAIVYERKIDVHRRMEDDQMKAMVPQFRTDKHELLLRIMKPCIGMCRMKKRLTRLQAVVQAARVARRL